MSSEYFSLSLFTDKEDNFIAYSKILNTFGIKRVYHEYFSKDMNKKKLIETGFAFIDINEKSNIKKLKNLLFYKDCIVVILSSFSKDEIKQFMNDGVSLSNLHLLPKPLDFDKLSKIIKNGIYFKRKTINLKSRDDVLAQVLDRSDLFVSVFDSKSQIIYANVNFIDKFVDENSNLPFDFRERFKIPLNYHELIHRLKITDLLNYDVRVGDVFYEYNFFMLKEDNFLVAIAKDITNTKSKYAYYTRVALFFEQSNEAVMITDENANILTVNNSFCKITGYDKSEAIGQNANLLKSGIQLDDFYADMWQKITKFGSWQGEIWNKRKNNEVYSEWLSISRVVNPETKEKHFLGIFSDISKLLETDERIRFYAHHDPLTKLLNRRQFDNMLRYTINTCERAKRKFALLFVDVDHFKNVNDTYGHDIGDMLLKKIASIFQNVLRKEDLIARVGGDEFCIILNDINHDNDVIFIVEKMLNKMKQKIEINHISFFVTLSIGISIYPEHGRDMKELTKNADQAMFEAKKSGRDNYLLYNKSFTDTLLKMVRIQKYLKNSILKNTLMVHYQPYSKVNGGEICGVEALVRLKDKDGNFIDTQKLISIAEENGMIKDVGKYVAKRALEDFAKLKKIVKKDNFILSLNLSTKELFSDGYIDRLVKLVEKNGLKPEDIELELTETQLIQEYKIAIKKFKKLKSLGFNIAIDDFGVGYSSLSYLKMFPIDKLKIDKSFIIDILQDSNDKAIVETIINMARLFKFQIQVEGIETKEHLNYFQDKDCDFIQGYHLTKALCMDDLVSFIKEK